MVKNIKFNIPFELYGALRDSLLSREIDLRDSIANLYMSGSKDSKILTYYENELSKVVKLYKLV